MATITFTIPDGKLQRIIDSTWGLYPCPQIPDPEWVDPDDGSSAPLIYKFTPQQWAKQFRIQQMKNEDYRYRLKLEKEATSITIDDELVT